MPKTKPSPDRKEQIVTAAVARLYAVGFEGFRIADVAKDVGINNATLIHHFPSKVALIKAVVEKFTRSFETVAAAIEHEGTAAEKLARHMQSSVRLMRNAPEMFVVLNEIMVRARRDAEISRLVSIPLMSWRQHIVSLLLPPAAKTGATALREAEAIATACMAQLLGMGLLLTSADPAESPFTSARARAASRAIAALAGLVA